MGNELEESAEERRIAELPLTAEIIGFAPDKMNACSKCGRANPPTRPACFYCSAELENIGRSENGGPIFSRSLENWENGFNVVYLPQPEESVPDISAVASFLSIEPSALERLITSSGALPLARLESIIDAENAAEYLTRYGMNCSVISDESLSAANLPKRLRGVRFAGDSLFLTRFNVTEEFEIGPGDVVLIVTGAVFEAKAETVEKRKKKESSVVLETRSESNGGVIDLYVSGDPAGYRIPAMGFDFSCLGAQKSILAAENIRRLTESLRDFAASARFVDNYVAIYKLLDRFWPVERRRESYGRQGTGFGGKDFTNIELSNNLQQFTKYSRLQRQLL